MTYAVGSLVKARGREWVVLPESQDDLVVVRPLGGTDDEVTGILPAVEKVEPAAFGLPDPRDLGDHRSCRLLRDAVRLGFRSSAGPFRSFGRIAVEPRPYQLVPLLLALKLDPIRLLIADDVGIGKTVEACLVAREMLDRGEVERLAVLCPPQLAEQWQGELRDKFHIDAELVLPSTAHRLERHCRVGQSLFEVYPHVIVSLDFIKSDKRLDEFLRACPELVIVDEAHGCAQGEGGRSRHQRYRLIRGLSENPDRHMIFVTATPHSGKEDAFRSLLSLLDPSFANLPDDLGGDHNRHHRERLAAHFVQRRRADIRHFMAAETPFPERLHSEQTYKLSPEYTKLFERVIAYAREVVEDPTNHTHRQRVRYWSVLALLRSLASSPAAAASTLRSRAETADTTTAEDADDTGRRRVLDLMDEGTDEGTDVAPGSDLWDEEGDGPKNRRRLTEMAREAEALLGAKDTKLQKAAELVAKLIEDGSRPIVFCRFIPTAEYVAAELRKKLGKGVEVAAVTGTLPPAEREERVLALGQAPKRVLVCTDCLSEGIHLQDKIDPVCHDDLPWNPTRLEQREGRVDRYGQARKEVRAVTYYGIDNGIDGKVLDVLLRKHRAIRNSLGISVPVPVNTEEFVEAVFEGFFMSEKFGPAQAQLRFEQFFAPKREELFAKWDAASEREKRSRTLFAQERMNSDLADVTRELRAAQEAVGLGIDVARFTREALLAHGAHWSGNGMARVDLAECPRGLRDLLNAGDTFVARFEPPIEGRQLLLTRTHPVVEGLASYVMDTALDPLAQSIARRCGVIRTRKVSTRTTLLLVRMRYHILKKGPDGTRTLLAEDCAMLGFTGAPQSANWLDSGAAEELLSAAPDANVPADQAADFVQKVLDGMGHLLPVVAEAGRRRGEELLAAHGRVRKASRHTGVRYEVEANQAPDILGVYVYLPAATGI
ncbi:MAG: DEAD/DEAH box helicase [Deltaproteobacteria bacterium]|nr:DEAD/DEAH box helicase [Deltaproteobacteria bacterium]